MQTLLCRKCRPACPPSAGHVRCSPRGLQLKYAAAQPALAQLCRQRRAEHVEAAQAWVFTCRHAVGAAMPSSTLRQPRLTHTQPCRVLGQPLPPGTAGTPAKCATLAGGGGRRETAVQPGLQHESRCGGGALCRGAAGAASVQMFGLRIMQIFSCSLCFGNTGCLTMRSSKDTCLCASPSLRYGDTEHEQQLQHRACGQQPVVRGGGLRRGGGGRRPRGLRGGTRSGAHRREDASADTELGPHCLAGAFARDQQTMHFIQLMQNRRRESTLAPLDAGLGIP